MTVAFDLDDTLALERDYVKSGFKAVAEALGNPVYFDFLWQLYLERVRGSSFNQLLANYPELASRFTVTDLVKLYRSHKPTLPFIEGIPELLSQLKASGVKLAIISDGPLISQSAKVEALNLTQIFDLIILTDIWGKTFWKPHPRAYVEVEECLASEPFVFVGDNPAKDFVSASGRGWESFCLRLEGQLHFNMPIKPEEKVQEVFSVNLLTQALLGLL